MRWLYVFLFSLCPGKSRWSAQSQPESRTGPEHQRFLCALLWKGHWAPMQRDPHGYGGPAAWGRMALRPSGGEGCAQFCADVRKPRPTSPPLCFIHPQLHGKHAPFLALLTPTESSHVSKSRSSAPSFSHLGVPQSGLWSVIGGTAVSSLSDCGMR